jgi:DNA (cytosine-5)-methyltransferase 1
MPKIVQAKLKYPTVLDVFCGAGGMSLGFYNAGCRILGGIDNNPHAIRTHHKNFPDCKFKLPAQDISSIDLNKLPIKPGEVDILIGGPPCQVFSRVGIGKMKSLGKKIEEDPRNFLYQYFVKFLQHYKPLFFVMENVDALVLKTDLFSKILNSLELGLPRQGESFPGYRIQHSILNASNYGVPQVRQRLFIVGIRQDLDLVFEFPKAFRRKKVTVSEAISDLIPLTPPYIPLKEKTTGLKQTDFKQPYLSPPRSDYQIKMRKKIRQKKEPDGVMNHICRSHNPVDLICFAMLSSGGTYLDLPESMRRYRWDIFDDKYKRLPWDDEQAWTLTAHMRKDCLAYIHPKQNRSISVREAARLQSFPDDFVFDAPMTRMFELVGNSVPPLLAEAIA